MHETLVKAVNKAAINKINFIFYVSISDEFSIRKA